MDPDTDVCQTEQPQISYSVDFTAEQSSAMGSPILLDREGITQAYFHCASSVINIHAIHVNLSLIHI